MIGLLGTRLDLQGRAWAWIGALDPIRVGVVVVGLFVATWTTSIAIWKYGRIEERWTPVLLACPDDATSADTTAVASRR